ncbi:MAG: cupin domain-containing protein [Pseudomonadota bacterium]|nr:MAG: cupin domain-containing protein [Pseudomonadota bacterium]
MASVTHYRDIAPYATRDGSQIRELMHPVRHACRSQSLAEATLMPGEQTRLHRHTDTEELYHISAGAGRMRLGDVEVEVATGDTICIARGTPHCIANSGDTPLRILCC